MLLIFSLSLQLVKLFRKVQWRDRSERSVLNGFYISLGTEESLPVCLQLPCTAGPILSTEDTVPALLSSRLTTNHSPDACSVHWSCWKAHQCSCWLHWEDEVRSFNWGLHSSSLTTSWIPQAFPPPPPLSEPAPSPPFSPPTPWVPPQLLTLEVAVPRSPKQPLLFGCEEPSCAAVSRTAASIWESYNAQTCKGWELEASLSYLECPARTMCNWLNAIGDMVAMSSQIPRAAAFCCTLPWTGWLLWSSSLRLSM